MQPTVPTKSAGPRLIVTMGFVLSACATSEPRTDTVEITRRFDALCAAYVADDIAAITSFYEEDAVRLPAASSIVTGLEAIRERMVRSREQVDVVFDDIGDPVVQRSGDLAVTYSTYAERRISKASGAVTRQIGQWLLVWRRQEDGSWRVSTETWTVEATE